MQVWRISLARYAQTAFSGEGARLFPGRWNPADVPMVYTSTSLALAAVEMFVNLKPSRDPGDLVVTPALFHKSAEIETIPEQDLPPDWASIDSPATRKYGADWIASQRSLALRVPSVPIRGEWNVLINPNHPDFSKVILLAPIPWHFDSRMFRSTPSSR